jgi:DNA-binding response OmpR family regulator
MPDVDGFQFITRPRGSTDATVRDIPAAALAAFARSDDRTKALRSGFEMHMSKPVDPGELVASLAMLVRRGARPLVPRQPRQAPALSGVEGRRCRATNGIPRLPQNACSSGNTSCSIRSPASNT